MSEEARKLMPFLDWGEIWRKQIRWSNRDLSGEKAKEMQKDMLAYLDWGISFMKGETKDLAKGYELYDKMCRWKPEDFPLKKV